MKKARKGQKSLLLHLLLLRLIFEEIRNESFKTGHFIYWFMENTRGIILVLFTAVVSGLSIFLNSFAVQGINPFVFTALKNSLVAIALFSLIALAAKREFRALLSARNLGKLALIGLVGGSIPFALFFYALDISGGATAGFIHKSLFIFASLFAIILLREKMDRKFLAGAALLFAGNFFLFPPVGIFSFPALLIFAATLLWALENVISKHALGELPASMVAFGRMFFGALFLLSFLALTGQAGFIFSLSIPQIGWVLLTSALLFLYVFTYYSGLKHLKVSTAASVLLLAQPITLALSSVFLGKAVSLSQGLGMLLVVFGVMLVAGFSLALRAIKWKGVSIAGD